MLGPLLEGDMSKKCTPLWREAHFQVKMYKGHHARTVFEVDMSKKCTPLWREAHFEVQMYKAQHVRAAFGLSFCVAGARDWAPCQKCAKCQGFVAFPKTMADVGHLQRICKDAFRVAHQRC